MKKKTMAVGAACGLCALSAVIGACAATAVTQITAELRPDFTIVVDGQERVFKNVNGDVVDPVLYEGTTYLPVRAIGELMGKKVYWYEDQKKIELKDEGTTVTDADVIVPGNSGSAGNTGGAFSLSDAKLTEEQARAIALEKAGLADAGELKFNYIRLDRDDGRLVYEMEFFTVNADGTYAAEYDIDVDANTGEVVKYETEPVKNGQVSADGAGAQSGNTGTQSGAQITEDQAKAIALEKAGLAESGVRFEKIKLDREHSRQVYEVEFYTVNASGRRDMEYDAEIDAATGEIVKWETDRD